MNPGVRLRICRVSATVVAVHAALIGAALHSLSTPMLPSAGEHLIMANVVTEMPAPMATSRPSTAPARAAQQLQTQAQPPTAHVQTTPAPVAAAATASLPVASTTPASAASPAPASAQTTAPAPAALVLPSSDADYLNNPAPVYPRMSRRLGEQGTVVVRVFINTEGRAEQTEIRTSSGYTRLDEAALDTVKRWRYVPGKRAGTAEAMWFNVPVRFVLD